MAPSRFDLAILAVALGALLPRSAPAIGIEGGAAAAVGSGFQARGLGELALALDPQILLGVRLEGGLQREATGAARPLARAHLGLHWRFDRSHTLLRLAGLVGVELLGDRFGTPLLSAELGFDLWPTPFDGLGYGLTLTYELQPGTRKTSVLLGLRLRWGRSGSPSRPQETQARFPSRGRKEIRTGTPSRG